MKLSPQTILALLMCISPPATGILVERQPVRPSSRFVNPGPHQPTDTDVRRTSPHLPGVLGNPLVLQTDTELPVTERGNSGACVSTMPVSRGAKAKRPNVLFIAIDDLRPVLGCYGDHVAVTPNIDRLADRGTVFNRAYCQQAVCSPSRLSLMTGRRPDTISVWDLGTHFRAAIPDVVTLPQYFRHNGYHTRSLGKIYHGSGKPSKDPPSWSVEPQYDLVRDPKFRYALAENLQGKGLNRSSAEAADVPDSTYIDGIVCDAVVRTLGRLQQNEQPFFLAVGFRKPHLPFCALQKYWDLYDRAKIPLSAENHHPRDAPEQATRSWNELEGYTDIARDGQLSTDKVRELRHGYYACVSYVDALVGRLLDELKKLNLTENTVVVLWGDHGFHLGEQGLWTKASNYELSTRVPLIVSVSGQARTGVKSNALVEFVDVYSTLADIEGTVRSWDMPCERSVTDTSNAEPGSRRKS